MKKANVLVLSFLQYELWFLNALMVPGKSKACMLQNVLQGEDFLNDFTLLSKEMRREVINSIVLLVGL